MNPSEKDRALNFEGSYRCPVCRCGQIRAMVMMDAFGCSLCRHIFTANVEQQILRLADSPVPLAWQWNGQRWRGLSRDRLSWNWALRGAIAVFVVLPTALVGGGAYYFPPLPGSRLAWLPPVWAILTLLAHLTCVGWLLLEYYQFPLALFWQAWRDRLLSSPDG